MCSPSSPARSASGTTTSSAAPSRSHCSRPSSTTPGPGRKNDVPGRPAGTMTTTKKTARLAGIAYLGLGISGALGFLLIRSQLFEPGDAAATSMNLIEHEGLARLGIAADLTVVLTQSLAALYFFKLFRDVNTFAAGSLAAFGFMNSVAILVATAFSATALQVALSGAAVPTAADT